MQPFNPFKLPLHGLRAIEASAGTGKTWSITLLHLRLVLSGLPIENILVTTFTSAATAELRDRLRERLAEAIRLSQKITAGLPLEPDDAKTGEILLACPNHLALLQAALSNLDLAPIHTIHGLASRILAENAATLGLDPDTTLVTDTDDLIDEILDDLFIQNPELFLDLDRHSKDLRTLVHLVNAHPDLTLQPDTFASPEALEKLSQEYFALCSGILPDQMAAGIKNANTRKAVVDRLTKIQNGTHVSLAKLSATQIKALSPELTALWESLDAAYAPLTAAALAPLILVARELPKRLSARKREFGLRSFDDLMRSVRDALDDPLRGTALAASLRLRYDAVLIDEFQDTDAIQSEVFSRVFSDPLWLQTHPFLLIGDPKQSIYQFRGADLASYQALVARADLYTMDTNHRSDGGLVEAVNTLYTSAGNDSPEGVYDLFPGPGRKIPYFKVKAAHQTRSLIHPGGTAPSTQPCLTLDTLSGTELSKSMVIQHLAFNCAKKIAAQLSLPPARRLLVPSKFGPRPLAAADYAVLAHTRAQLQSVQHELRKLGIPSVFKSGLSIFATHEAREILLLLQALSPGNVSQSTAFAALATSLLGLTANDLHALKTGDSGDRLAGYLQLFQKWSDQLGWQGPLRLLETILNHPVSGETPRRRLLLQTNDGERKITNWLHLAELLQQTWACRHLRDADALATWLERKLVGEDDEDEEDSESEQCVRLETQEDAVHLVTIHAAKGLEYGIVFCPFLWALKSRQRFDLGKIFFNGSTLDLGSPDQSTIRDAEWKGREEEQARLLYVAITRAKHQLHIGFAATKESQSHANASARSWISRLLLGQILSEEERRQENFPASQDRLLTELKNSNWLQQLWSPPATPTPTASNPGAPAPQTQELRAPILELVPALAPPREKLRLKLSFTLLHKQGKETDGERETLHYASGGSDEPNAPEPLSKPDELFPVNNLFSKIVLAQPRLKALGVIVHSLLENAMAHPDIASDPNAALLKNIPTDLDPDSARDLLDALLIVLNHPMPLSEGSAPCCLKDITQKASELQFLLPFEAQELPIRQLQRALSRPDLAPETPWNLWVDRFSAHKQIPVHFLEGVIDLIFLHEGKWYVLDYKTNGGCGNGSQLDLEKIMLREDYVLQSYLYTLAWHRRLQASLGSEYDYDRDFGGIAYLFLRALPANPTPGDSRGLWLHKVDSAQLFHLEQLIATPSLATI
jgi:exodeoxyribonuclease V beta subunit